MVPHLLIRYFFTDLMRCRKSTIAHLLVTAPQAAGLLGQVGTTRTLPASPPPAHKRCRFAIEFYLSHSPPPQAVGQPTTSRARNREDRHALSRDRRHGFYWGLCRARFARSWASGHRLRLDAESG